MANKLYEENDVIAIADAIRTKNGTSNKYKISEMADAVLDLNIGSSEGGIIPTGSIEIKTNGTHDVTNYANAIVSVPTNGGDGLSIGNWHTGSFTIESNENGDTVHTVMHNLGYIPTYVVVWADEYNDLTKYAGRATIGGHKLGSTQGHIRKIAGDITVTYSAANIISNITETSFDFGSVGAVYIRPAGWTYRWFAL